MAERNAQSDITTVFGTEVVDISSADHTFVRSVRAVYVSVTGTVVGRLPGDSADTTWTNVPVGDFLRAFTKITRTGTTATVLYGLV